MSVTAATCTSWRPQRRGSAGVRAAGPPDGVTGPGADAAGVLRRDSGAAADAGERPTGGAEADGDADADAAVAAARDRPPAAGTSARAGPRYARSRAKAPASARAATALISAQLGVPAGLLACSVVVGAVWPAVGVPLPALRVTAWRRTPARAIWVDAAVAAPDRADELSGCGESWLVTPAASVAETVEPDAERDPAPDVSHPSEAAPRRAVRARRSSRLSAESVTPSARAVPAALSAGRPCRPARRPSSRAGPADSFGRHPCRRATSARRRRLVTGARSATDAGLPPASVARDRAAVVDPADEDALLPAEMGAPAVAVSGPERSADPRIAEEPEVVGAAEGRGTGEVGARAEPRPALGLDSEPVGDGTEGNDTGGAGTDGRGTDGPGPAGTGTGTDGTGTGTDGNGADGTGTAGVVTAGVVTAGVETCDGTLTVPAGVGIRTGGADTGSDGIVVLGTDSALAAAEASVIAISTLRATERGMRIVRDMCAETHTGRKTYAKLRTRARGHRICRARTPKTRAPTVLRPKSDSSTRYYERRAADDRRVSPL